ncbi:MAG: DUF4258 domain-containing protein [Candidatus Taylorbacteria bacterium]|nr:DUF4258 domain-containing protein [Candidatus Taylorbacteria bacterium]
MKIKFSLHFIGRLAERGISVDHLKQAIQYPDYRKGVSEGRILVGKKVVDKTIEVVYYRKQINARWIECKIITAYYINL